MRIRLLVAYDGSRFRGIAPNPGVRSVGGEIATVCERVLGHDVTLTVAGRTDAGVHAWGQVVTFDTSRDDVDPCRLQGALNAALAPEVVVREADVATGDFDARRSATWRHYRYTVLNRPVPDPFTAATSWYVPQPLSVAAMEQAAIPLIGEHDFSSFCRRPSVPDGVEPPSLVRRVTQAGWSELGEDVLRFEIRASSFCQQMVRSIVGLLVDVGRGRRHASDVQAVLVGRDRSGVGQLAPPHGLCLWEVGY